MTKPPLQKPTASELEILRVLWERGPSTVRDVREALREKKDLGYTTVLKLLQIMTAKGTVRRNEEQRAHVYEACQPATETKRQLVGDVLQRVFEGSASELMIHALEGRRTSKAELDELRRLLDEYEGRSRWATSRIGFRRRFCGRSDGRCCISSGKARDLRLCLPRRARYGGARRRVTRWR